MKKEELKKAILKEVETVSASIVRVYGLSMGVGYDLDVFMSFKNGYVRFFEAHALRTGWAYPDHLRPNNPYYKYTGSNDVYQSQVIEFWQNGNGFECYLGELKKADLEALLEEIKEA